MSTEIKMQYAMVSREAIAQFERSRGIIFPKEYKRFLLENNGGRPVPDEFDVPGWVHRGSVVNMFFGLETGDHLNLERECNVYSERVPAELMPIACDVFGNVIALGITGKYRSKIYFWDHEDELDENGCGREDHGNVYLLAKNLDEFLNKLYESKDE